MANDELDLVAKPHRMSKKSTASPRKRVHHRSLLFQNSSPSNSELNDDGCDVDDSQESARKL